MAKCLVLGANGFIGSHLVDSLIKNGQHVRVFDRFKDEVVRFNANSSIEKYAGDFLNRHDLKEALVGIDFVFHFISTTTPMTADSDPLIDIETNVKMTIELLQECVSNGNIKKVIFASTGGAIYGLNSGELVSETITPLPISPYAIGKLTIEHYLRYFETKHNLPSLVFRISNPYGERQSLASKQGVIPIFLQHIAEDEPITILGDGSMVRDYIYVKDVAHMIAGSYENATENLYNLGSGHGVSVNELVDTIGEVVHQDIQTVHYPKPATFIEKNVLDTIRFDKEFGIKAPTSLEDGIFKNLAVYRTMSKELKASVIIPTYNGETYLAPLLASVFQQKIPYHFEVLIIDSGSADQTLNIIKDFPKVRLHTIPNSEFGHGKTRNLAAEMAKGEFAVYLSQDAVPAHSQWLEAMLEPFELDKRIVGVFGKQIPRPHCDAPTKREVSNVFNSLGPTIQ